MVTSGRMNEMMIRAQRASACGSVTNLLLFIMAKRLSYASSTDHKRNGNQLTTQSTLSLRRRTHTIHTCNYYVCDTMDKQQDEMLSDVGEVDMRMFCENALKMCTMSLSLSSSSRESFFFLCCCCRRLGVFFSSSLAFAFALKYYVKQYKAEN